MEEPTDSITMIGKFIAESQTPLPDVTEALMFLLGDALAQITDATYDEEIIAEAKKAVEASYKICCNMDPEEPAVQIHH